MQGLLSHLDNCVVKESLHFTTSLPQYEYLLSISKLIVDWMLDRNKSRFWSSSLSMPLMKPFTDCGYEKLSPNWDHEKLMTTTGNCQFLLFQRYSRKDNLRLFTQLSYLNYMFQCKIDIHLRFSVFFDHALVLSLSPFLSDFWGAFLPRFSYGKGRRWNFWCLHYPDFRRSFANDDKAAVVYLSIWSCLSQI